MTDLLSLIAGGTAAGCAGVVIYYRGIKDLMLPAPEAAPASLRFKDEYQELMWLANAQRYRPLRRAELARFYELRDNWTAMHEARP